MKSFTLPIFILFSSLITIASAQPQTTGPMITARLKCLVIDGTMAGAELLQGSGKRTPLNIASDYISREYVYQGPAQLTLLKSETAKNSLPAGHNNGAKNLSPEILASVSLPQGGGEFLLLFFNEPNGKTNVMAVPFSASDVPLNNCLFWNVTPRNLGLSLGGQKIILAAGARQLLKPSTAVSKNYFDLKIFDEYQGQARPLIGGAHFLNENSRQLVLIVERTPGQVPLLVRTIEELPEPPAALRVSTASIR